MAESTLNPSKTSTHTYQRNKMPGINPLFIDSALEPSEKNNGVTD